MKQSATLYLLENVMTVRDCNLLASAFFMWPNQAGLPYCAAAKSASQSTYESAGIEGAL